MEPMSNSNDLILDFPRQQHHHRRRHARSSPSLATTKMKKSVSFSELSMMSVTTNNLSYASKSDLWYTQNDIKSFRLDCAHMIHKLKQSSKLHHHNSTDIMGLEGHLFNSSVSPMQRRREVQVAVLLEQHRHRQQQRRLSMHDEDLHILLARASQRASKLCRKRAEIIGHIHAHDYNCNKI